MSATKTPKRETWHTRWPLLITRLPPFPLFVTLFLTLTVLIFSFAPHQYRPLASLRNHRKPQSNLVHGYGERQNPGRIRLTKAPRANVWSELGKDEIDGAVAFLRKNGASVGVPDGADLMFAERLMPNKTNVLPFLEDSPQTVDSWARVVMAQNRVWGGKHGGVSEWMVGPLPVTADTQILPLSYIYNSGRNYIRHPLPDLVEVLLWFKRLVNGPLRDMMKDLLEEIPDSTTMTKVPGLMALSSPSTDQASGAIQEWLTVQNFGHHGIRDAFSLLSQGMYAHLNIRGLQEDKWSITEWYYNGVLYNSTETFRSAWKQGKIRKTKPNKDGDWTNPEPTDDGPAERDIAPPVLVQPYGPRVEVDPDEKYVKWLDWEFYLSFSQVTAVSLFDIRFQGDRIIYELGLQEAMAHYAGDSPATTGQLFFDTMFGFGVTAFSLVPGFDCPAYATFLPGTFYREGKFQKTENAICVFEAVSDHPLQRHTSMGKVTASRNSYLVVRTVSTVGNYDYTISYMFYLDGSIEVKVHASGYIFTDYLGLDAMRKELATRGETQLSEYGYRIHDVVMSSLHTHELLFKADLDVAGIANTVYHVEVEPMTKKYSFEETPRNTMHIVHTPIKKEAGLDWPRNSQGIYVVLNNASTNAWGEKRGYKVVPGTGMGTPPHLAIENSTAAGNAARWALHDVWVLKQHDHELKAASEWNSWEIADPLVDFQKMVNGESTVQEDLVLYFNLGAHHLSNSQDIPNTLMHWSGTSVMFVPHNYHDSDPSRRTAQGVRLKMGEEKVEEIKYYGARYDKDVFVRQDDIEPSLKDYRPPNYGIGALSHNISLGMAEAP